jgi:rod shape-determining protein MreC
LQLQLLDPYAPLKVGDRLVSFGVAHGIYGTGFPVGTVTSIRGKAGTATRVAEVEPFVAMGALDIVSVVIAKPRDDPRDSLLPAIPTPVATDTATSDAATPTKAGPTSATVTP